MSTAITTHLRRKVHLPTTVTAIQTRSFARWVPYKPTPKPKLHQNLLTLKTLKKHLENSYLVSPFPCHGISANSFKALKSPVSSDRGAAKIVVVKNKLVTQALSGTKWEKLGGCMKGMNSLMFVKKEECVGAALNGVKARVKEGKMEFNEFSGAVVDGELFGYLDLKVLENTPSKVEGNAMVLNSVFGPSSSLMAILEGFADQDGSVVEGDKDGAVESAA